MPYAPKWEQQENRERERNPNYPVINVECTKGLFLFSASYNFLAWFIHIP
jgi:hypothetical protein